MAHFMTAPGFPLFRFLGPSRSKLMGALGLDSGSPSKRQCPGRAEDGATEVASRPITSPAVSNSRPIALRG
jgi:hypothetical protein